MADADRIERKGADKYTKDGTVDINGRPCRRSVGGRWTACSFILAYEALERLAYFGIAPNLVMYLTNILHQGTVSSVNNVTNWYGTIMMTPILGAYVADAHLGRYWTFLISSAIYLLGMILLTLTVSLNNSCNSSDTEDCSSSSAGRFHIASFFLSLYIIAAGTGGTKPNISAMGADQFDIFEPKERSQKSSFFNWWVFAVFFGNLFSSTVLVYIQDNVSWSVGYAVPTSALLLASLIFIFGTPFYRHKPPSGSPATRMAKVLVAAARKWRVPLPGDPKDLYELDIEEYPEKRNLKVEHTESMRLLDKAAVRGGRWDEGQWSLCPVTHVEEAKQIIKMLPVYIATLIPSIMLAQALTLFIKQGTTLDRSMGPHFQVPPASLSSFLTISSLVSIAFYDRHMVPLLRKRTKRPQGITLLQRIGAGQALHFITMAAAALTERLRLMSTKKKNKKPLSVFVLVPQFTLMGVAEMLIQGGKMEFFQNEAPEGMKSLGVSFFTTTLGIGNFLSSFLLSTVQKVTKKGGNSGWIENNLNESHLDYYYGLLAALNVVNFIFFLAVSRFYVYKKADVDNSNLHESSVSID